MNEFTDISDLEKRIYKNYNKGNRTDSAEQALGGNFYEVEKEYNYLYYDYFYNLILNLITYENAPMTFDGAFLEFQLRTYGYARIGGSDKDHIHVFPEAEFKTSPGLGNFGFLVGDNEIDDPLTNKKIKQITHANYEDLDNGYVFLSNKYGYYYQNLGNNYTDVLLISRVAKTLAKIKATSNFNLTQMKLPYIGYSTSKNLTAMNVMKQIEQGQIFIQLDQDIGDIEKSVQIANLNVPNWLSDLKDEWNNNLSELLTMLGINNVGVDKKERLVSNEANSNSQLIEASGNIYLDARNNELALINKVFGTNIQAVFNQESYNQLVSMLEPDDEKENGTTDSDNSSDLNKGGEA